MNLQLRFWWKLFLRRLPAMMALFLLCAGIGLVMAMRLPTIYETSARLLVEDPQIPDELAESTVQTDASEQIEIVRQQLMTRANLIEIAEKFGVFPRGAVPPPDEVVAEMRSRTKIQSSGGTRARAGAQPTLVTVSFRASSGQIAADVVNEYVTRIMNANVELRTGLAEDTLDFFRQEVERLAAELDRSSALIAEFRQQNADALPDSLPFRMGRQALLQERMAAAGRERASLIEQRTRILAVFEATGSLAVPQPAAEQTPEQKQLAALEAELSSALAVYSETNPKVVALKAQIAQLSARIAATTTTPPADGTAGGTGDGAPPGDAGPRAVIDAQLAQIDAAIAGLEAEITGAEAELASLADSIARTPANGVALQGLERDHENIRSQYDASVRRLAQASVGERIELSARGQRISLIEAANVPAKPSSPNRPRIAAMGAAAGLGLAGGLFLLLEILNRSVRTAAELTKAIGILPLATIPYIESRARRMFRRSLRIAALILVVAGIPAGLWAIDTWYLPLDLLAERLMDRLGLA